MTFAGKVSSLNGISVQLGQKQPHITILMAVLNGADMLGEQLESILGQDHRDWQLLASDDGSSDESGRVIAEFSRIHPAIVLDGPGRGAAQNFLSLLRAAPDYLPANGWVAFADQDDVWLSDRLSRGIAALAPFCEDAPALYCSRTWVVDRDLQGPRLSPAHSRGPAFRNALIQNIAPGNTILLNAAAARLVCDAAREIGDLALHDWWVYQLVAGAGGHVVHDDRPTLLYRQHGHNTIGANVGLRALLKRIGLLFGGSFKGWNDLHLAALNASSHRLTAQNRALLEQFCALRQRKAAGRIWRFAALGLHCQTRPSTIAFWLAAALGRL